MMTFNRMCLSLFHKVTPSCQLADIGLHYILEMLKVRSGRIRQGYSLFSKALSDVSRICLDCFK
jgi:hypothetical protein